MNDPGLNTMRLLHVLDRLVRPPYLTEPSMGNQDLRDLLFKAQSDINSLNRY